MSVRPIHAVALITLALVAALPAVAEASFPTNADRALLDWITSHATTKIDGVVYSQVETDDMSTVEAEGRGQTHTDTRLLRWHSRVDAG